MIYDFGKQVTQDKNSAKWSKAVVKGGREIIPMWVADMDFLAAREITRALAARAEQGIFGYTQESREYTGAIADWNLKRHSCKIDEEWIVPTPGVVTAINLAVQVFTKPGDSIVIQTPVYHPFFSSIESNGRVVVKNPLLIKDGSYQVDFIDLEKQLKSAKMLILCNPHNPTGKVYTKEELIQIAELCYQNKVYLISDEIHQDLVFRDYRHVPFLTLDPKYFEQLIVTTAPSKTFNIAGLSTSNCIIPNESIRRKFLEGQAKNGPKEINLFGRTACEAAYTHGEEWLDEVLVYLEGNLESAMEFIQKNIPALTVIRPQGTYFLWIDCTGLNIPDHQLNDFFIDKANVFLNDGAIFGQPGYIRMNIACRRELLIEALNRVKDAVYGGSYV